MNAFKITYSDGNTTTTSMNATLDEATEYYVGKTFNVGAGEHDKMVKAVSVEQV